MNNEIFIQVKGIGFTFLLDKRMRHNLISPAFLAFFNLEQKQMYSLPPSVLMTCSIMLGRKWEDAMTTS